MGAAPDADRDQPRGELHQPPRRTSYRLMLLGAGIRCPACGHPWALQHLLLWDGTEAWMGFCPEGHCGCPCGHSRMRTTMRELGVPPVRRALVAMSYYVLRQWRE